MGDYLKKAYEERDLDNEKKLSYEKLCKHWFDYDWFGKKQKYGEVMLKLDILEERLTELERIVKNQPLIKKYQKTLDIFLKNAKN